MWSHVARCGAHKRALVDIEVKIKTHLQKKPALDDAAREARVARVATDRAEEDRAFAEAKASGLTRRGYGERRVRVALDASGIDEADRAEAMGTAATVAAMIAKAEI